MAQMHWRDEFSVKIESIDRQHRQLIDLINQLEEGAKQHEALNTLSSVLSDLKLYTTQHFRTEETLMQKYNYPGYASHRSEHQTLIKRIQEFQGRFEAGKLVHVDELANFLMGWLEGHILATDKRYSPYLVERGVR